MKRLFKMLSLLSILLILGSCDSSKAINVSTIKGEKIYVRFINFDQNVYKVVAIYIDGVSMGVGSNHEITSGVSYKIKWEWIEDKAIRRREIDYTFKSIDAVTVITLGTGLSTNGGYENIFYETYLY